MFCEDKKTRSQIDWSDKTRASSAPILFTFMIKLFLHLSTNMNSIFSYCNINYHSISMAMSTRFRDVWWSYINIEAKLTYVLVQATNSLDILNVYYPFTWLKMKAWEAFEMRLEKTK